MHRILKSTDYLKTPWKNGKGVTEEILISPSGAKFPQDSFDWRLSTASLVEDGTFSTFSGYDRILTLIQGSSLELAFQDQGTSVKLGHGENCSFKGEERVFASLSQGPVRDLNFIVRRSTSFDFKILRLTGHLVKTPSCRTQIYYVIQSELELRDIHSVAIVAGDTLILDGGQHTWKVKARNEFVLVAAISIF